MRLGPIIADADIGDQRHRQLQSRQCRALHHLADHLARRLDLGDGHFEDELVMHLEQHAGLELRARQRRGNADHGPLDDVGGGALDGGVDGGPLHEAAPGRILVGDPRHMAAPAEERRHIAAPPGAFLGAVHVIPDAGIFLEIGIDVDLGLALGNAELGGQAEGRDAVDDAEIDRLGLAPDHGIHALDGHAEDLARGQGMDVDTFPEGLLQGLDLGHMGGEAELDLGIIHREQLMAGLGDEGAADLAALLRAHRDVLEIGIVGGDPPRRCGGEREGGMDPAGRGIDLRHQRVGISALELGELAPIEDPQRQIMALGRQLLQHIGAGGIGAGLALFARAEAELVEQHLAQLLGRADIEGTARELVDLALELGQALAEIIGEAAKLVGIGLDPRHLHGGHHRHQRPVDGLIDRDQPFGEQPRLQAAVELQGHIGIFRRIVTGLLQRHPVEAGLALAGAGDLAQADGLMAEMDLGELVPLMAMGAAAEHIGDQHAVVIAGDGYAETGHHLHVVFDVLADLQDTVVLQQRLQARQRLGHGNLAGQKRLGPEEIAISALMGQRHIAGDAGLQRQGDADQLGQHGIVRGGDGIEGDGADPPRTRDPFIEAGDILDQHIGMGALEPGGQWLVGLAHSDRRWRPRLGRLQRIGGGHRQAGFHPGQSGAELIEGEEGEQHIRHELAPDEILERGRQSHIVPEAHQLAAGAGERGIGDQRLAALRLLDLAGAVEQGVEIAIGIDQLRRRLDADAGHPRHIVGRIPGQGLDIHDLVRPDAELLPDLGLADAPVLDRVQHGDIAADELHQILVGGDDGDDVAPRRGRLGIGCDQIVGLIALELDGRHVAGAGRLADQRELRQELGRRGRTMGLVIGIDLAAEGSPSRIEDDGDDLGLGVLHQPQQHVGEAIDCVGRGPVGAVHGRQSVEGAEDITRAVDQIDVVRLGGAGGFAGAV